MRCQEEAIITPMSIQDIELSTTELDAVDWQAVVRQCPEKIVHSFRSVFSDRASIARDAEDPAAHKVFAFFAALMHFVPNYSSTEDAFITMYESGEGWRTPLPSDISEAQLDILAALLDKIEDTEMRAHIADILWTRRRDYKAALTAATSYFESGSALEATGDLSSSAERLERSLRLAARLGNKKLLAHIVVYIDNVLASDLNDTYVFWAAHMLELLLAHKVGAPAKYADIVEKLALQVEARRDWYTAQRLWELQARCYALSNAPEEERAARVRAAETHVQQAEDDKERSYGVAAEHLRSAIQAYRRIGAAQERIQALHVIL